jgi:dolichyl-phosphate-mannose-protein mannosyltransferase
MARIQRCSSKPKYKSFSPDVEKHVFPKKLASFTSFLRLEELHYFFITVFSLFTRLYAIGRSPVVSWDEAHFGKFANEYISGTFYSDVHPPLGKLIITSFALLGGYNGDFNFAAVENIPDRVNISWIRGCCAVMGALLAPLTFAICRNLSFSLAMACLASYLVIFDNALLVISKFVLLDPILLFFTALSLFCATEFQFKQSNKPFTAEWLLWASFTGVSLGCLIATKLMGLFTYALVGLMTAFQLWQLLAIARYSPLQYLCHWLVRITTLIALPFLTYALIFALHFSVLSRSGPGAAEMNTAFQASLQHSHINNHSEPQLIQFGGQITLRSQQLAGNLLHSHPQNYPNWAEFSSKQQQVTTFPAQDNNNFWLIKRPWSSKEANSSVALKAQNRAQMFPLIPAAALTADDFLHDGDILRLLHRETRRNLHSHESHAAPLTTAHNEVSGYGNEKGGDENDHWRVEVVQTKAKSQENFHVKLAVHSLITRLRLRHVTSGCYLTSTNRQLPAWYFFKPISSSLLARSLQILQPLIPVLC